MSVPALNSLSARLKGNLYTSETMRLLYATDASAYREIPLAIAIPADVDDLKELIKFARENNTSLIPRTAGTSLAGQVVGNGIVVDVSKTFTRIGQLNAAERWIEAEPGVIRDELNVYLKKHGLFFGPETSTANRAMLGGMVGNNSCGSNSVVYGSTRDHLLEIHALLSDGSEVVFKDLSDDDYALKLKLQSLEGELYRHIDRTLRQQHIREEIKKEFPRENIERRNTGYALDMLLHQKPFTENGKAFNFCDLIAGSEGTLCFITKMRLHVDPLPPPHTALLCVHFNSIDESLKANLVALQFKPSASELIDHYILECTKDNLEQRKNRFFVLGDPGAILVVEFSRNSREELEQVTAEVEAAMKAEGLGYHFPVLYGDDCKKIWTLRKAGLGLLSNLPGDEKAVPVIEDTAVDVRDLPAYIAEFNIILKKHGLFSVHYAHAGSGELHLRPIINLKTEEGNKQFRIIAEEIAALVKKYNGSLSGEHGDGRLRGEFIPQMIGEKNYALLKELKKVWDEKNIFNPGKIVDSPPMDTMLRFTPGQQTPQFKTYFRYHNQDVLQHAEQCNGSGDCRKTEISGGTMCPSYMATRNEQDTTRARANILREFLTNSSKPNRFDHNEIKEVMDLCLSCKGCKSECPSNVDVAKLKAEFLQQYYDANGIPFRSRLVANFTFTARVGAMMPSVYNWAVSNKVVGNLIKKASGFAVDRSLPLLHKQTLRTWFKKYRTKPTASNKNVASLHANLKPNTVYLFADEFTNYNDVSVGIKAIELLQRLGYEVVLPNHEESARTWLSKGLLKKARTIIDKNIELLSPLVREGVPLVGIEPSAILTMRDEYPELCSDRFIDAAKNLAKHSFTIEEFIAQQIADGHIQSTQFTPETKHILLHGHCQQKALVGVHPAVQMLSAPANYHVQVVPSGCCGMAGSFGYEKEHYSISQQIGELVLYPAVRNAKNETLIAAAGTSCRHQIKDGTGRHALHPVEILFDALA